MNAEQPHKKVVHLTTVLLITFSLFANAGFSGITDNLLDPEYALGVMVCFLTLTIVVITIHMLSWRRTSGFVFTLIYLSFFLGTITLFYSFFPEYAYSKIVLGLLCPVLCCMFLFNINFSDEDFRYAVIFMSLIVAVVGLLYRAMHGFDPEIERYGFFGPIPFGWFCSLGILASLELRIKRSTKVILISLLVVALFWSGEKGPMLALLVTLMYLTLISSSISARKKIKGTTVFMVFFTIILVFIQQIPMRFKNRSLAMIKGLLGDANSYIKGAGAGSIGIRLEAYRVSIASIHDHLLFGIGLGNWKTLAPNLGVDYPHNVPLEIIVELGLVGFILFALLWWYVFKKASVSKVFSIYMIIALLFSGDMTYLRYVLFPILIDAGRCHYQGLHRQSVNVSPLSNTIK